LIIFTEQEVQEAVLEMKSHRSCVSHFTMFGKTLFFFLVLNSVYMLLMFYDTSHKANDYLNISMVSTVNRKGSILVTGGMGNIGKYVVRGLLLQGYKVLILDLQEQKENLVELLRAAGMDGNVLESSRFRFRNGDIRDADGTVAFLTEHGQNLEGVIHLAAISRVEFCLNNERDCYDINVNGTSRLLDSLELYMESNAINRKPWLIFASSREIYGSNCTKISPCSENSPVSPLNVYGESKFHGENIIQGRGPTLLSGMVILRLASVYGGLFDIQERLIPSIALRCATNTTVELNGGEQVFDFVHVQDVEAAFLKSVRRLEMGKSITPERFFVEDFLICSGEYVTVKNIIAYVRNFTNSKSEIKTRSGDTRYPAVFVCDNEKMKHSLGYKLSYPRVRDGIMEYLRSMFAGNIGVLTRRFERYCSERSPLKNSGVRALQNCSVFITSLDRGSYFLKHLSHPTPALSKTVGSGLVIRPCGLSYMNDSGCFTLQYEASPQHYMSYNNSIVLFHKTFDPKSGGYQLQGSSEGFEGNLMLSRNLSVTPGNLSEASRVSIWPYSCPVDTVTSKARLPIEYYDPSLYLLRQIIPPEEDLPDTAQQPLACRRIQNAIQYTMSLASKTEVSTSLDRDTGEDVINNLPICDSDCTLWGGCINTGSCRCVSFSCIRDRGENSRYPFDRYAFTNMTSFSVRFAEKLSRRDYISSLPYHSVLRAPARRHVLNWKPSKVHVVPVNISEYFGISLDDRATTITKLPDRNCFSADHFLFLGLNFSKTAIEDAEIVFIPFYEGWLTHYIGLNKEEVRNGLQKIIAGVQRNLQPMTKKRPRLLIPLTHDYGAAFEFSYDMRDFIGTSLRQHPSLKDVIVLSPFGDFNTLAYQPHKDIVIPPVSCRTPLLLHQFRDLSNVQLSSSRESLLYFNGAVDQRTGSFIRSALLSGSLFPNSDVTLGGTSDHSQYMMALNNSKFCPHVFGTTGWATRLSDSIYAGCIPVLTADITHPPFWDILRWEKFSVYVDWRQLEDIEDMLQNLTAVEVNEKQGWLLKVRDAFLYDPDEINQEWSGQRKGPVFHSMLSWQVKHAP
jgi:nucleoside-diphosphate-sugar epimerase